VGVRFSGRSSESPHQLGGLGSAASSPSRVWRLTVFVALSYRRRVRLPSLHIIRVVCVQTNDRRILWFSCNNRYSPGPTSFLTLTLESPAWKTPHKRASMELLLNNSMRASDAYCVQADGISALFLAMTHEGALLLARNQPPLLQCMQLVIRWHYSLIHYLTAHHLTWWLMRKMIEKMCASSQRITRIVKEMQRKSPYVIKEKYIR